MDNTINKSDEVEKFCCFIYLVASLVFGTPAIVYILEFLGVAWNKTIMWFIIMFFSLFTAWFAVPIAAIIWIINKIF